MMAHELPKLPEPAVEYGNYAGPPGEGASDNYWSEEQMRAYATAHAASLEAEVARLRELRHAAQSWWDGKRPAGWNEEMHLAIPTVNCQSFREDDVASAIARLVRAALEGS